MALYKRKDDEEDNIPNYLKDAISDKNEIKSWLKERTSNSFNTIDSTDDFNTNSFNSRLDTPNYLKDATSDPTEIKNWLKERKSNPVINSVTNNNTNQYETVENNKDENKQKNGLNLFTSGGLKNSDNFWVDSLKSNLASQVDVLSDVGAGISSVVEAPIDIVTNLFATVQDLLGFDEAAKNTREFANINYSEKISNFVANIQPVGIAYNTLNSFENKKLPSIADLSNNTSVEQNSFLGETSDKIANQVGYVIGLAGGGELLDTVSKGVSIGSSALGIGATASNIGVNIAGHTLNLPTLAIFGGMSGALEEANSKENVTEVQRWTKALGGGAIEGITEGMFGLFGVGGNELTDELATKAASYFSSSISKTLASLGIKATGEAIEELMSYDFNFIWDNLVVDNFGSGDFQSEWNWEDVGEQMALAFASTLITSGGGNVIERNEAISSAENQLNRKLTKAEKAKITQTIIAEEMMEKAIVHFDPEQKGRNVDIVYHAEFSPESGEIINIRPTLGKSIENPNKNINIEPAIIKNTLNNSYNIVDKSTGVLLDTTPYESIIGAETEFIDKINKLDEKSIKALNTKVNMYKLSLYDTINNKAQTQQTLNIISTQTPVNQNTDNLNNETTNYVPGNNNISQNENMQAQNSQFYTGENDYTLQDIDKVTNMFDSNTQYTADEIVDVYDYDWDMPDVTTYDENGNETGSIALQKQGDNIVVEQWDTDGNVIRSNTIEAVKGKISGQEVQDAIREMTLNENRPVAGQIDIEGNEVGTAENSNIQKDIENFGKQVDAVMEGTFPKNDMLTLLSKTPQPLIDIGLTNLPITMTQKHLRTIMENEGTDTNANYHGLGVDIIKQLPEAINNPLDIVESNTRSDSVVLTTYLADSQDRTIIASIKIDGKGRINNIRIDTNVMTSAYGKDNYDEFMRKNFENDKILYDIDRGVIKKVAGARLQLPRRNNSRVTGARFQLPRSSSSATKTNGSSITNRIPQTSKVVNTPTTKSMQKSQNNTQNNQNTTQESNEDYLPFERIPKKSAKIQNEVDNQGRKLSRQQQVFFKNSKIRDTKGNLKTMYHGTEANIGIPKEYWFTIFDKNHIGRHNNIIADGFYFTSDKEHSKNYAHLKGNIYEVYLNVTNPLEIKSLDELLPYKEEAKKEIMYLSSYLKKLNYDGIVYSDVCVVFDSNQIKNVDNKTPTSNDDIRYMRKSKSNVNEIKPKINELAKKGNIKYNIDGIQLGKREYKSLISAINTDNPNLSNGIHGKFYNDNYYVFEKMDFNNYLFSGKIQIEGNEELIKKIIGGTKNGTIKGTKNVARTITEFVNGTGLNNTNNDSSKRTRKNKQTTEIRSGYDQQRQDNNQERNNNKSTRNQSRVADNSYMPYDERKRNDFIDQTLLSLYNNDEIRKESSRAEDVNENFENDVRTNAEGADRFIEQQIELLEKTNNWDDDIPVTSRSDIRKTIEDYLGLNLKKGHFRQAAYGLYKSTRDVIRVKEYKDMDNVLHEVGHALDLGNRIQVDKEKIASELLRAVEKHGGYEEANRTEKLDEGFAEVIREYSIVPEQAKIDYPQSVAVLEAIREQDEEFDNFISTVQEQIYNYIHQNPRNRELGNQSIGRQQVVVTKEYVKERVIHYAWDKDYVIKVMNEELAKAQGKNANEIEASKNVYYLTRLLNGVDAKAISMLTDGYIDTNGEYLMPGLSKIGEILGEDSERWNDLRAYLVAKRDIEYKAKKLKTGLRTNDSKAVIEQFANDTEIQEAAKIVYNTLDGVLQYAVNNGLITQELASELRKSNAFYVPMQRDLGNNRNVQTGKKGGIRDLIKKRTGSELDVKDVLENIIGNSVNMIRQVERNNVMKAIYKSGEEAGLTGAIYDKIDAPMKKIGTQSLKSWQNELEKQGVDTSKLDLEKNVDIFAPNNNVDYKEMITSFIDDNGKRIYLQFYDNDMFVSLMGADSNTTSILLKITSYLNKPLRFGATMGQIGFAIPNMISDTMQAGVYSEANFTPFVDTAIGVIDVLAARSPVMQKLLGAVAPEYLEGKAELYKLYQQSGATSSKRMSAYRKSIQEQMSEVYGIKGTTLGVEKKFRPLKGLMDFLSYIPELSEEATRFRVFEKNYDYYTEKGETETNSRILAALQSRDATQDFSRMGTLTAEINKIIPFSAARVGSAYTFAEKIKNNPTKVGAKLGLLMALGMMLKAISLDDDEINELNQRKKDDNFVFRVGDTIMTLKKPQGILRSMINLSDYMLDLISGNIDEGKEGKRLGEWLENAIMDNMPADSVTGAVPSAILPVIENAVNKDFYYNTDIVKSYDLDLPNSEQYYDYNSQLAIWLGQAFNYSPAKIDNLISGYFAGLGTDFTRLIDSFLSFVGVIPEKADMGAEQNPVGKRFVVNVNSNSQSVDDLYTEKTELTKKKNGGTITDKESEKLEAITQATKQLSALNKQIKAIKADENMSGKEKADKIRELQSQKTDTAREALGKKLINSQNKQKIAETKFYPSSDTLKSNGTTLTMTVEMQQEYSKVAAQVYNQYKSQGLYSEDKLESKSKEYAKKYLMEKYKSKLKKAS